MAKLTSAKVFWLFAILLYTTLLAVLLDLPILRQLLSFLLLIFVPGFLVLGILKLNSLEFTEQLVLSVGLSISFLMFFGLFINWVYPYFGCDNPLSTTPVVISLSIVLVILAVFAYLRNRSIILSMSSLNRREKLYLICPATFPLLSIIGIYLMDVNGSNSMLIILLVVIPIYIIMLAILRQRGPDRIYPTVLWLISISLVLLPALRTPYVTGHDSLLEYAIFQRTNDSGLWQVLWDSPYEACLSISILPGIYQSFLDMDSQFLFKILYPLLCSFLPLVVFVSARKHLGNIWAFLAAFFVISVDRFMDVYLNVRTPVAILFFALSAMVLFHSELSAFKKKLLFIIFAASCIISHYSTAYIFFFILLGAWFCWVLGRRIAFYLQRRSALTDSSAENAITEPSIPRVNSDRIRQLMTGRIVCLFFTMVFFWYGQMTGVAFNSGIGFISEALSSLQDFFLMEAHEESAQGAVGVGLLGKEIPKQIEFMVSWLTIGFVGIGMLIPIRGHWQTMPLLRRKKTEVASLLPQDFRLDFHIFSLMCVFVLLVALVFPAISERYTLGRVYFQMMVILAPFLIIGGILISRVIRTSAMFLILPVLIVYFICSTGFIYQAFGFPKEFALNNDGTAYNNLRVYKAEGEAAKWLEDNENMGSDPVNKWPKDGILTDFQGRGVLLSQAGVLPDLFVTQEWFEKRPEKFVGYIFLRSYVVESGYLLKQNGKEPYNIAENQVDFANRNKIYCSKRVQVWR